MKNICDNETFWKIIWSSLSDKGFIFSDKPSQITLVENNTFVDDKELQT